MAKKNDITVSEMRALLPWFLAVNAVYFALLLVLFFACGLNYTMLLGGVWAISGVRRQLLPDGEVRGKVAAQGQRKVRPELHEHYVLPEISRTVPCNDSRSVRSVY